MHVLITCKNKDNSIKNEGARVVTTFFPIISYIICVFSRRSKVANSAAQSLIWQNFKLVRDLMVVLVTCKNEEVPIKNEGDRVLTTLNINFSDARRQITPELVVVSGRISNSSKLSCISLSSARMNMIRPKMKEPEWSQHFYHYKSMEIFPDAQGQLTPQSLARSG